MSLRSWLASVIAPPPPPPAPVELDEKQATATGGGLGFVGGINSLAFPQPLLYAALGGYASNTGVPVTPLTALQSAAVYGCCKCIAEDIGGLDVQIRRRLPNGGWVVDRDHPLNLLFRRPNRWQTPFQFWNYLLFCAGLRGNYFCVVQRNMAGAPVELVPVSPDRVTLRISPETGMPWYIINSRMIGMGVMVPADDMLHFMNMSFDGYLGLSPIACAQDTIGLALATQQHGAVLFRQGGQVAGIIRHPGKLGERAKENIAESWRNTHGGVQNAHKPVVLEEGMTFEKVAITNEDAQFLQTRQFQVSDICRLYRVPPHKLAELGRATFSNIEQQQQQYIDDCLTPYTRQTEEICGDRLFFDDERDNYEVHFDFTSMLRGDQLKRFQAYQIATLNGWMSRNEVRARENMNPIPGGDEYRVPLNTGDPQHPETLGQRLPSDGDGEGDGEPGDEGDEE